MGRSRAMEFYRFASAVLILCYHCNFFFFSERVEFATSYLLVELFFLLSGFLMYRSVHRRGPAADPVGATMSYMKGRLIQLYPHHLFSWLVIAAISLLVTRELTLGQVLANGWPELLLVNIFGYVRGGSVNIVCWYLSALLFGSLVVYYLLVSNERRFVCVIAPLLLVFLYGTLYDGKQCLAATIVFTRYARFYGCFRSVADLTAGVLAGFVFEKLRGKTLRWEAAWATLFELAVFIAVLVSALKKPGRYDFYYVPLFFGFVISVFRGQSLFSRLLDNPLSDRLGELSYAYYLNNLVVILPYRWLFPEETSIGRMCVVCGLGCFLFSLFSTWLLKRFLPPPRRKPEPVAVQTA